MQPKLVETLNYKIPMVLFLGRGHITIVLFKQVLTWYI